MYDFEIYIHVYLDRNRQGKVALRNHTVSDFGSIATVLRLDPNDKLVSLYQMDMETKRYYSAIFRFVKRNASSVVL